MSDRPTKPPERLTIIHCPVCGFTRLNQYQEALVPADGHCDNQTREVYRYELIKETDQA